MLAENDRLREQVTALQTQLKLQQIDNENTEKSKEIGDASLQVKKYLYIIYIS